MRLIEGIVTVTTIDTSLSSDGLSGDSTVNTSFWTIRKVLLAISVMVSAAILISQFWAADSYRNIVAHTVESFQNIQTKTGDAFLVSQEKSAQSFKDLAINTLRDTSKETLEILVTDRVNRQYIDKISPRVQTWSRYKGIVKAVKNKDAKLMELEMDQIANDKIFAVGDFTLVSVTLLSADLEPLAYYKKGKEETVANIPVIIERLAAREKKEKRKFTGFYWRTDEGVPVHSLIAPIGGFKVAGFIELVTIPVGMLQGMGQTMGGDFALSDVNGNVLLEDKILAEGMDQSNLDTISVGVKAADGDVWANATLVRDVTNFNQAIKKTQSNAEAAVNETHDVSATEVLQARDTAFSGSTDARNLTVVAVIILIVVAWSLGWVVLQTVAFRPMKRFAKAMFEIGEGHTEVDIPKTGSDEMGVMAEALAKLRQSSIELKQVRADQEAISAAQKRAIEDQLKDMSDKLNEELKNTVSSIQGNMQKLLTISDDLADTAGDAQIRSESAANAAENATTNAENVVGISQDVSNSFEEVLGLANKSSDISGKAADESAAINQEVMALSNDAKNIGDVIDLITEIADQTNMLALNATIESARAGDAGKGFAVVANEVKELANRTTKATDEIATQIRQVQSRTEGMVTAISSISKIITQMNDMSASIANTVQTRSTGTQQIISDARDVAGATKQVTSDITEVTGKATHVGDLSQQVRTGASEVSEGIDTLRDRLQRIL